MTRLLAALVFSAVTLPLAAWAQPLPPNVWHPYRGGTNCVQVADANGRFNCAAGTTIDPATGNMVVGGTLTFGGQVSSFFPNGIALATVTSGVQILGTGDLVVSTSPVTVAQTGPLILGATLRVRRVAPGLCQWVTAGGNAFQEFVIPTLDSLGRVQATFPGGLSGC